MTNAVFAIPGDKDQRTGGYLYNARVSEGLRASGAAVTHLQLPDSFPAPSAADLAAAHAALNAVPSSVPVIVDGLAFGAMDPTRLPQVQAPIIALVHHPLGHETDLSPDRAAALIANETACLAHAAHVVVTSWHTADALVDGFGVDRADITVALPGFDRPVLGRMPTNPPLILSVGLLTQRKGHDVLLDALARITDLDWRAEIVGRAHDPAIAGALRDQTTALGLDTRVMFRGEVGAAALQEAYASATLFALATRYEGYGMVLGEAMLHCLPIVSCKVGAVPDTVGDAGCLVAPDDPDAFAAALRTILTDPAKAKAYAHQACRLSQNLPEWQDTAAGIKDVIAKVAR